MLLRFALVSVVTVCLLGVVLCERREADCSQHPVEGPCPYLLAPVCASIGGTFNNECEFCAFKARIRISARIFIEDGACPEKAEDRSTAAALPRPANCPRVTGPRPCPKILRPVCASNGETFSNECMLCAHMDLALINLMITHDGECVDNADNTDSVSTTTVVARQPVCEPVTGPRACPKVYRPVCASNGETFSNECMLCAHMDLALINLMITHDGECKKTTYPRPPTCRKTSGPMPCPRIYQPICASNGVTYNNLCAMCSSISTATKSDVLIMHEGECVDDADNTDIVSTSTIVPRQPVCEPVTGPRACPKVYRPVCASNGETFSNECMLCAHMDLALINLMITHDGECKKTFPRPPTCRKTSGPMPCPRIYQPICASNGVTYSNLCVMCSSMSTAARSDVLIMHEGRCEKAFPRPPKCTPAAPSKTMRLCTMDYRPVCADDGQTYGNECAVCGRIDVSGTALNIVHKGECKGESYPRPPKCTPPAPSKTMRACTADYRPVCADDGKTYGNECAVCGGIDASGVRLNIVHEGECKPATQFPRPPKCTPPAPSKTMRPCTADYRPVCADDGKTYGNECAVCGRIDVTGKQLTIVSQGECKQPEYPKAPLCVPPAPSKTMRACIEIYSPVCGDDGKTYENECAVCSRIDVSGKQVKITQEGECGTTKSDCQKYKILPGCPRNYRPVCHLAVTYANECLLCRAMKGEDVLMKEGSCPQK